MKIAVLSDIHGNYYALEASLEDARRRNADKIVFLGDFITDFPFTREVMDTVLKHGDIVVRGNRESYMLDRANGGSQYWENHENLICNLITYNNLAENDIEYLRSLPVSVSLKLSEDTAIMFCHGSPESEYKALRREEPEIVRSILENIQENYLICGHCHKHDTMEHNGKTLINAGSVGVNYNGDKTAAYVLLTFENGVLNHEFIKIPYNFQKLKDTCDPENIWLSMVLITIETGVNATMIVLDECCRRSGWPIPNDVYRAVYYEKLKEWDNELTIKVL